MRTSALSINIPWMPIVRTRRLGCLQGVSIERIGAAVPFVLYRLSFASRFTFLFASLLPDYLARLTGLSPPTPRVLALSPSLAETSSLQSTEYSVTTVSNSPWVR